MEAEVDKVPVAAEIIEQSQPKKQNKTSKKHKHAKGRR
jgi:hypothetical protein